jgi:transposase-like protein
VAGVEAAGRPLEFRGSAVRLVRTGGKLIREVADDLGVSEQTLRIRLMSCLRR